MMVNIAGRLINPMHVVSAEVETRHYMNGSSSCLVVRLTGGSEIRKEHGYGFDAWAELMALEAAMRVAPSSKKCTTSAYKYAAQCIRALQAPHEDKP